MPFRKRSHLLKPDATPEERAAVQELLTERSYALLKIVSFITMVLFVIVVALEVQIQTRNGRLEQVDNNTKETHVAAQEAKEAASKASTDLANALARTQSNSVSADAIRQAVEAIARIEAQLCDGPCPTSQSQTAN